MNLLTDLFSFAYVPDWYGQLGELAELNLQSPSSYMQAQIKETIAQKPQELVEKLEKHKAEEEKRTIEDDVRARLRGFCRTIPSFIMAYGDGSLILANFDDYTEADVFLEVTGITEDDFRFFRDGGDYTDEDGNTKHFDGHLFDETVFNDSVGEFWKKSWSWQITLTRPGMRISLITSRRRKRTRYSRPAGW